MKIGVVLILACATVALAAPSPVRADGSNILTYNEGFQLTLKICNLYRTVLGVKSRSR